MDPHWQVIPQPAAQNDVEDIALIRWEGFEANDVNGPVLENILAEGDMPQVNQGLYNGQSSG